MKKLLGIMVLTLLLSGNASADTDKDLKIKTLSLVCNDSVDASVPLSIYIFKDTVFEPRAIIGDEVYDLKISDVMYTILGPQMWATIQRNDGRFHADWKIGSLRFKYDGFCKKNEPKF